MNSIAALALSMALAGPTVLSAQSQQDQHRTKAKDTVDRIREADPPKEKERQKDDTAQKRADEENAKERERQKAQSQKYHLDKDKVPPPSR